MKRLVIGVTGASGITYAHRTLLALRDCDIETHLVISRGAELTIALECSFDVKALRALATYSHDYRSLGAPIASGSFKTMGMLVIPCSSKTLAEIATGSGGNLLARSADVTLKERRRLVLMPREAPLHLGHLRNMVAATEAGAIISPPMPALYPRPDTIDDLVDQTVGRALDLFDIDSGLVHRWVGCAADARNRRADRRQAGASDTATPEGMYVPGK